MGDDRRVLAVFSTEQELMALLKLRDSEPMTPLLFVAMTSEAGYAAERSGLVHKTVEHYVTLDEINKRGLQNFRKALELCHALDEISDAHCPTSSNAPAVSAEAYYYALKILLDMVLWPGLGLIRMINAERPSGLIFFSPPPCRIPESVDVFPEDMMPKAAALISKAFNLSTRALPSPGGRIPPTPSPSRRNLLKSFRKALQIIPRLISRVVHPKRLCIAGDRHWPLETTTALNRHGIRFKKIPKNIADRPPDAGRPDIDRVKIQQTLRPFFELEDIDLFPAVEDRILYHLWTLPRETNLAVNRVKDILVAYRAEAVISRAPVDVRTVAIAMAARQLGLPVLVVQHGGGNGYLDIPIIHLYDRYFTDHYFCYGPGVADYFKRTAPPPDQPAPRVEMTYHIVGSYTLRSILHSRRSTRTTAASQNLRVLYVHTNQYGPGRLHTKQGYLDIFYCGLQRDVVKRCIARPNVHLTIKSPMRDGATNPMARWLSDHNVKNCDIVTDKILSDVLESETFDLILCDAWATSLLEVVATNAPVILLLDPDAVDFTAEGLTLINRRVIAADGIDTYLAKISETLESLSHPGSAASEPYIPDDAFLARFGIPLEIADPATALAYGIKDACNA